MCEGEGHGGQCFEKEEGNKDEKLDERVGCEEVGQELVGDKGGCEGVKSGKG